MIRSHSRSHIRTAARPPTNLGGTGTSGPPPAPGFLTWDASTATGSPVLSNDDTTFLSNAANVGTLAADLTGGKYYAEVLAGGDESASAIGLAVRGSGWQSDLYVGRTADGWGWLASTGSVENNRIEVATLPAYLKGAVIRIALNGATGDCWLSTLGSFWYDSGGLLTGNPASGLNPTLTGLSSAMLSPAASTQDVAATVCTITKPSNWLYTPPIGFIPFPPA